MLWWDKKFLEQLTKLGISLEQYLRYVDDSNMVARALKPGMRFTDGKLSFHQEYVERDQLIPDDKRMGKILRQIGNEITPMIIMEEDVGSNHVSGTLPILDL